MFYNHRIELAIVVLRRQSLGEERRVGSAQNLHLDGGRRPTALTPDFVEIGTVIESRIESRIGKGARIRIQSETSKIDNETRIEKDCWDKIRIKYNWDRSRKRNQD
ncbi:hypothetical protein EVAR_13985_1 [Eumeta japonica]|uniref:Uncharacterized protein n=1 Tax=Eumeta variegata TaxID=151549 RepID=A0A4C1U9Z1_EUMVA|nr:hypothetical protein EVAR_13985_1 [Eumeta japonica]